VSSSEENADGVFVDSFDSEIDFDAEVDGALEMAEQTEV